MKTTPLHVLPCLLTVAVLPLRSATLDVDANANEGLFPVPGGTWDFGNTVLWSPDGGATRVPWTSNADTLRITHPGPSWGGVTLTADASLGALGTAGIEVRGNPAEWHPVTFQGDIFSLGAGGIFNAMTNKNALLYFNGPVELAAPQHWRSANASRLDGCGVTIFNGALSSAADTETALLLDGLGRADAGLFGVNDLRVGFAIKGDNTFRGTTTLTNGAMVGIMFTAAYPNAKLDATQPLVFAGGSLRLTGNDQTYAPTLSGFVVRKGSNQAFANNGKGTLTIGNIVREGIGSTFGSSLISWNGGFDLYVTGMASGFVGGWATFNHQMFANIGTDGKYGQINEAQRAMGNWTSGAFIRATSGGTLTTGDVAPKTLRITTTEPLDLNGSVVTIQSGGLMASASASIANGHLRTGAETGELFVHAFSPLALSCAIEDNGAVPLHLVKNGTAALTLAGADTIAYTGTTFLNSGSLVLADGALLAAAIVQEGGTTLQVGSGATLAPPAEGYSLFGSLTLGDGATLALPLVAESAPVRLTNAYASFALDANATVALSLSFPEGAEPARGDYALVKWDGDMALANVAPENFSVAAPEGVEGTLAVVDDALVYTVTKIPPQGTLVFIR